MDKTVSYEKSGSNICIWIYFALNLKYSLVTCFKISHFKISHKRRWCQLVCCKGFTSSSNESNTCHGEVDWLWTWLQASLCHFQTLSFPANHAVSLSLFLTSTTKSNCTCPPDFTGLMSGTEVLMYQRKIMSDSNYTYFLK